MRPQIITIPSSTAVAVHVPINNHFKYRNSTSITIPTLEIGCYTHTRVLQSNSLSIIAPPRVCFEELLLRRYPTRQRRFLATSPFQKNLEPPDPRNSNDSHVLQSLISLPHVLSLSLLLFNVPRVGTSIRLCRVLLLFNLIFQIYQFC